VAHRATPIASDRYSSSRQSRILVRPRPIHSSHHSHIHPSGNMRVTVLTSILDRCGTTSSETRRVAHEQGSNDFTEEVLQLNLARLGILPLVSAGVSPSLNRRDISIGHRPLFLLAPIARGATSLQEKFRSDTESDPILRSQSERSTRSR